MTADQATTTVTRTWTGTVRLRNAREHRALEHLWWWANTVRNALCEQALSICEHNRRTFLRHGTDWTPDAFASVLDDTAGRIVAHPRRTQLSRQWTEVAREAREHRAPDGFDATRFGRRMVGGIFDDFTRRYAQPGAPAPAFRPGWKLRSVAVKDARIAWCANRRDAVLRVQGLPALRVRLHRPVPESATTHGSIRLVRRQRPCRGRVPARYEIRLMVDLPARERCANARRVRGWDPGGRRSLTSDAGDVIQVRTREKTEHRRLARRVSRCKRGSRGWRKAKAAVRLHLERETRARDQHRHKQVHHAARKADVHVVELNNHAAMRRRGGKSKSRMNRSLAEAGPARTVQLLRHQCERHGKRLVEAPAPYNSRMCAACGSRETKLTRARIACAVCGHTADRDVNAAANALRWARNQGAVPAPGGFNREVSARRRETRAPQCPVPPESLGPETALARREPGKLPGQRNRQDFCPCPNPQEMCPNGQNSC